MVELAVRRVDGGGARESDFARGVEEDLLAKVQDLLPLLRSEAPVAERERSMTPAVYEALTDLDIWSMLLPRRWGGLGLSATAMSRINREIAKGDPAAAWVVQIINGTTWIASLTSDALQEELFGQGPVRICSSFAMPGKATPVDGGYIIDGLWPYNSGSRQSQWGQYLVNIEQPDGSLSPGHFVYVEMKDVEIVDTWFTAGLQGTSSDSSRIDKLFVPEHRMVRAEHSYGADQATQVHVGAPSDRWPVFPLIRSAGLALLLGAAEAALELALESAKTKPIPNTTFRRGADSSVQQRNLGQAAGKIDAARLIIEDATRTLDALALAGEQPSAAARAHNKSQASMVIELVTEALDVIMYCAGSSAFMLKNPLQRYWRDVNVAARHAIYSPEAGHEIFGRALLDVSPNIAPPNLI